MKKRKNKKLIINNRVIAFYDYDEGDELKRLYLALNVSGPEIAKLEDLAANCIALIEQKHFKKLCHLNITDVTK